MGGVHSRWLFHGTSYQAMQAIVNDPVGGFNMQCPFPLGLKFLEQHPRMAAGLPL